MIKFKSLFIGLALGLAGLLSPAWSAVGGTQYKTVLSAVGGLGGYNWRIYDS